MRILKAFKVFFATFFAVTGKEKQKRQGEEAAVKKIFLSQNEFACTWKEVVIVLVIPLLFIVWLVMTKPHVSNKVLDSTSTVAGITMAFWGVSFQPRKSKAQRKARATFEAIQGTKSDQAAV